MSEAADLAADLVRIDSVNPALIPGAAARSRNSGANSRARSSRLRRTSRAGAVIVAVMASSSH